MTKKIAEKYRCFQCQLCKAYQRQPETTINSEMRCVDPYCRGSDGLRGVVKEVVIEVKLD